MHKILIFTDIHIVAEGETIIGLDPSARFVAALDHALAHHGDAQAIFIAGDLTHHGRPEEYARLKEHLDGVPLPVTLLLGNHDNRANFAKVFADQLCAETGFSQSIQEFGSWNVIGLDTLHPETEPYHGGHLCADRMTFLRKALDAAGTASTLVIQHHPPMPQGFDGMDAIALDNGSEELAILAHAGVDHLICGHVHRTISGVAQGVSYSIFKSPCHQMPMVLGEGSSALSVDEPGAYGIVLLGEKQIIVHSEDVGLSADQPSEDSSSGS
ncbi:phosphodiesterase [Primorskyibacter sp. S187A]|uniref:phosphodiesterase n=1 Tax=Primorskyibacter sp. S187A TaxID=3415130 RepID=UPI003C7C036D